MHLSCIRVAETSQFEINNHQTPKPPMKENEIDTIPLITNAHPFLPANKGKIPAKLKEKYGDA